MSWKKDKVTIKVVNIESSGSDIPVSINGYNYVIQDQATVEVPRAVYNVLLDTAHDVPVIQGKMGDMDGVIDSSKTITKKVSSRFFVTLLDDKKEGPEKTGKKKTLADLNKNKDID